MIVSVCGPRFEKTFDEAFGRSSDCPNIGGGFERTLEDCKAEAFLSG